MESTTYPGTTRDVLVPILEQSGLTAGVDFFVAYSPEREDPGNREFSARSIPKVVGGLESNSLELANALYSSAVVEKGINSLTISSDNSVLKNTMDTPTLKAKLTVFEFKRQAERSNPDHLIRLQNPPSPVPSAYCWILWHRKDLHTSLCSTRNARKQPNARLLICTHSNIAA